MAGIARSALFVNGEIPSGTSDLLQRAIREVVDDDDTGNSFVTFLPGDGVEPHTIQLTAEQAAALGLTFEVDSIEEPSNEFLYQRHEDGLVTEVQDDSSDEQIAHIYQSQVDGTCLIQHVQDANFAALRIDMDDDENSESEDATQDIDDVTITRTFENEDEVSNEQPRQHLKSDKLPFSANLEGGLQCRFTENPIQSLHLHNIQNCQTQILKRLPVILPSSQFIVKPSPTILRRSKSVRILPNTNKSKTATVNTINAVHSTNGSGQNSIIIPKGKSVHSPTTPVPKTMSMNTPLLKPNISSRLLNTSQLVASSEIASQVLSSSQMSASVISPTPVSTQNVLNSQIGLSPAVLRASVHSPEHAHAQHFLAPFLRNPLITPSATKTTNVLKNVNSKNSSSDQIVKPVQVPTQVLRTITKSMIKTTNTPSTLQKTTVPTTTVFRSTPIVKNTVQDLKSSLKNPASVLRSTQQSSTPISILKPQSKMINCDSSVHHFLKSRNLSNGGRNGNAPSHVAASQPSELNGIKQNVTNIGKVRENKVNGSNSLPGKKTNPTIPQKTATTITEKADTTKPLGSSDNPIQIVQQGSTFHSMQRLTQSQLKQIAHVLQQRSQEATMPNETVVYRVVFPEELDLRTRSPENALKGRGGKRGRPKKGSQTTQTAPPKPAAVPAEEEPAEEVKEDHKKVVARTRSGRLSRPPRHMVRDYKHLRHSEFMQPDLDDSDGGYSDYNMDDDQIEDEESAKDLLTGLEIPKRKISDHFKCPTCHKIYLGRTRMARHFEVHPDHGSAEQLPPPTPEPEIKQTASQDPLKRKGKKRGPWAYVTPEAKSERRQIKLKEAISVCENSEIVNMAAKPVLNAASLYELLVLKSESNVRNFLDELKKFMEKIREKAGSMLAVTCDEDGPNEDIIELSEDSLCDSLGLNPGLYRINNSVFKKSSSIHPISPAGEPVLKRQRIDNSEETKENLDEHMSSGFSENSDQSVSDFLNDKKSDSNPNSNCPEVLTALTLMPRNSSPVENSKINKTDNASKLVISNPEIQSRMSENSCFRKVDINTTKPTEYEKIDTVTHDFDKLDESLESSDCSEVFAKIKSDFSEKMDVMGQSIAKLDEKMEEPLEKEENTDFLKLSNNFESIQSESQDFAKDFDKLESSCDDKLEISNSVREITPISSPDMNNIKTDCTVTDSDLVKLLPITAISKISESLPIMQDSTSIISNNCDSNLFGSTENLDISKISGYDHITHLDILNTSGVIDKNLMIDEKLVEQLHLVDQTNLVDELVSERLKSIPDFSVQISNNTTMPENILENNLISNNSNLDPELDFEALSEEFNRNTRS